jgi:hypothetical protein
VCLQNLTHVHTRRHAKRVKHDLDWSTVRQVRHVLFRQNPGNHAFVSVASGHLVAHGKLALHGDEDLDHLDYAGSKLIPLTQLGNLLFVNI